MAFGQGFIFGGSTGITADQLTKRRALLDALEARRASQAPQNIGEGIYAFGTGIFDGIEDRQLRKAEGEMQEKQNGLWDRMLGGSVGAQPAGVPGAAGAAGPADAAAITASDPKVYDQFIGAVKEAGLTNPYALAAVAATGNAESRYSAGNVNRSWSDPSESGQAGTAGGIMSWRGPRLDNLYSFARATGEQPGAISPGMQGRFFAQEDPRLMAALQGAGSVEEAQRLMDRAWQYAGYDKPGGEAARRMSLAQGYLPTFQQQSADLTGGQPDAAADPVQMASIAPDTMDDGTAQPGAGREGVLNAMLGRGNVPVPTPRPAEGRQGVLDVMLSKNIPTQAAQPEMSEGRQRVAQALLSRAPALPTMPAGPDPRALMEVMRSPYASAEQRQFAGQMLERSYGRQDLADRRAYEAQQLSDQRAYEDRRYERQRGDALEDYGAKQRMDLEFARQKPGYRVLSQEEAAGMGLPPGAYQASPTGQIEPIGGKGAGITIVNGQSSKFRDKADERMVERYGAITDGGTAASNVLTTTPYLRELLKVAPQGPLQGRLAEAFPGFSSAADAFTAGVNQIAPSLRIPGSGAQSDRDMDILLGSFPRLRNDPAANGVILDAFERKAQINAQRAEIANAALRGEITPADADRRLGELDRVSIIPDDMRQRLGFAPPPPAGTQPPGTTNRTTTGVSWGVK